MQKNNFSITNFLNHETREIIKLTVTNKLILIIFIYFISNLIPFNKIGPQVNFYYKPSTFKLGELLSSWDGQRYLYLADNGYFQNDLQPGISKFVLFPLYPYLISVVNNFTLHNTHLTALMITLFFSIVTPIFFYKLLRLDYSFKISYLCILLFLISPASIFSVAFYNESLFLMLTIATFYFLRTNKFLPTIFFGLMSGLARPQGVLLTLPLIIEYLTIHRPPKPNLRSYFKTSYFALLWTVPPVLGTLLVILFQDSGNHTFFTYQQATYFFGAHPFSITNIYKLLIFNFTYFNQFPIHGIFYSKLNFIFVLSSLVMLMPLKKITRLSYFTYTFLLILIPLISGIMVSTMRNLYLAFPIIITISLLIYRHPTIKNAYIYLSTMLLTLITLLFTNWYWVS